MSLVIELAPFEMAIVEDELLRNGAEPQKISVSHETRILREHEILMQEEANTPAKMLYLAIEHAFLAKTNHDVIRVHIDRIAHELAAAVPSLQEPIAHVLALVDAGELRDGLAKMRAVIAVEASILKEIYVDPLRHATAKH